ncbi:phytanoyl-CoA dioxygenase family protein [Sciscionella marina]|uniref:phytanoyl-CoA dioxygenase family protein n=1 Tax=Sciscionella marina TaxID=508770 RepID=UPI0012F648D6|nr:phytanoyl-CoA dioxygenase family protein [Sciscionella marina]
MNEVTTLETVNLDGVAAALERDGFAVVPDVLSPEEVDGAVERLWAASEESRRRGNASHVQDVDPNASNVRVFNLIDLDPLFGELIQHPVADAIVERCLGSNYVVSNFTANIARPGSGSMMIHSDQASVVPEPWAQPWAINIIWCLCDLRGENGATRHIPGSHQWASTNEMPDELEPLLVPFEAPAGSIVAMEGRVWHTSGANITENEDRPLVFGYYTTPFLRPQWNFSAALQPETQAQFTPTMRYRLGLDPWLNVAKPPN